MGKAIPAQHPAVVLRSHYKLVRALLAVAMIAVVGLTIAVVIVARDDDPVAGTSSAGPVESIRYGDFNPATGRPESAPLAQREHPLQNSIGSTRYDGGPEEGTRGALSSAAASSAVPGVRYDGGPEEGAHGIRHSVVPANTRYDGGPDEGSRGMPSTSVPSGAAAGIRFDGGPEEGSRGPTTLKSSASTIGTDIDGADRQAATSTGQAAAAAGP